MHQQAFTRETVQALILMDLSFRLAKVTDASRVAEVLIESREAFMPFAPSAHTAVQTLDWVRDVLLPRTQVTVAISGGMVVGVLAISNKGSVSWIEQLYIHPSHVGQGIGSTLLARAIAAANGPIRLYTFQENMRARKFYERYGFVAIEFTNGSSNEELCPDVLYELADT